MSTNNTGSSTSKRVIKLVAPVLTHENIIGHKAGLRPFRKGGVRFEEE